MFYGMDSYPTICSLVPCIWEQLHAGCSEHPGPPLVPKPRVPAKL